jgi:hypothetical protein
LFALFVIQLFLCWQTHGLKNGATSVPRQHRPSNRHTGSFRSSHRVVHRGSGRRAVGNAYGPGGLGVGTATRRGSSPHNVVRALDSEVAFRRVGPWGCPRFFYRPVRLSASTARSLSPPSHRRPWPFGRLSAQPRMADRRRRASLLWLPETSATLRDCKERLIPPHFGVLLQV